MKIDLQNQHFVLDPAGVAFWEEKKILLISDVHLGKISHFRKFGSAVPAKAIDANFIRLSEVVGKFQPEKIYFLGDLFHSSQNKEWQLFRNWLRFVKAEVFLIAGNHDVIAPLKYEELGVKIFSEIITGNFLFTHHPMKQEHYFNICGHVHPGIRINGKARQHVKLACFFEAEKQFILPAFGEFTGNHILELSGGEKAYTILQNEVILIAK